MNAGRELDRLIADKVMGLMREVRVFGTTDVTVIYSNNPYFDNGVSEDDMMRHYCLPLHYSTDIADAWQVVEKMDARGLITEIDKCEAGWGVNFVDYESAKCIAAKREVADTISLAICLAALQACGVNVEDT